MARVTVEDCIKKVPNRFELVLAAAQRARELASGAEKTIDDKDKNTVLSLREIAAETIEAPALLDKIMMSTQRLAADEADDDDEVAFDNVKVIGTEDIQFQTISQQNAEDQLDAGEASEQPVEPENENEGEMGIDGTGPEGEE